MADQAYAPTEGDFVQRFDGNSNVHIAKEVGVHHEGAMKVTTACGAGWYAVSLRHATEAEMDRRPCRKCWEEM